MDVRVLLVDDDSELRAMLREYLEGRGFAVSESGDGQNLAKIVADNSPDVVLLDLMLPGDDGLTLCRRLREGGSDVPVIMLTAKGDEVDRIVGLEVGADDYLPKPFNPRELVARIGAILRRRGSSVRTPEPAKVGNSIVFGPYTLNLDTRTLSHGGNLVILTSGEYKLLSIFALRPYQPLDRERLLALIKDDHGVVFDRAIDSQISRLRKKIEPDHASAPYLQTVRGFGYVFAPNGTQQ